MEFVVAHELPGRIRLRTPKGTFSKKNAPAVEALLESQRGVKKVKASYLTGSILICFEVSCREGVLSAAALMTRDYYDDEELEGLCGEAPQESLKAGLAAMAARTLFRLLLPLPLRKVINICRASSFVKRGARSLLVSRRVNVSVLDASAILSAVVRGDFVSAGIIMTLVSLGDLLESWTQRKSKEDLAQSLALRVDTVWVRRGGCDVETAFSELHVGDLVVVRAGTVIPVDGRVAEGEAVVNQSSMTGEPLGIVRKEGASVYAGTVVEEGMIVVETTALGSSTRISRIISVVEESESRKASIQGRAERLADSIVPFNFILAGVIYLSTRSAVRASSALMVDYSCAIKLATPLAILASMREGIKRGVLIKGGKYIEALADADTAVFDKTGTLTVAEPRVAKVIALNGYGGEDVLKLSACLEEHFPHSIAKAVVRRAEEDDLHHAEEHAEVEYAVAHGIVSSLRGERVIIGSSHFVFEDEGVKVSEADKKVIDEECAHYSLLYLAVGTELAGIICIDDPLRGEAREVVSGLRAEGVPHLVMLTGDCRRAAENTAAQLGIGEVRSEMLPVDKSEYVRRLTERRRAVIMVGDGVNDSPALSAASVGVSMRSGADIAQEVANVVLLENDLRTLVDARRISVRTMRKIHMNYRFIVGTNTLLLALGLGGFISPALSALLHNLSTVGASIYSLAPVLGKDIRGNRRQSIDR